MPVRGGWDDAAIDAGIALLNNNVSLRAASEQTGVSKDTLRRHRAMLARAAEAGLAPVVASMGAEGAGLRRRLNYGPATVLSYAEEMALAEEIIEYQDRNCSLTTSMVRRLALEKVKKRPGAPAPHAAVASWIKRGRASCAWLRAFQRRNPFLSFRTADNLSQDRKTVSHEHLRKWYAVLKATYGAYSRLTAADIWNADETCMQEYGHRARVMARKGSKKVRVFENTDRKSFTLMLCVSASGDAAAPLFILNGEAGWTPRWLATEWANWDDGFYKSNSRFTQQVCSIWHVSRSLPCLSNARKRSAALQLNVTG